MPPEMLNKRAKLFLRLCSLFIITKEKTLADNEYQVSPLNRGESTC